MALEVMREMSVIREVAADHKLGCQFYILGYGADEEIPVCQNPRCQDRPAKAALRDDI
jgi:hypothetical protein